MDDHVSTGRAQPSTITHYEFRVAGRLSELAQHAVGEVGVASRVEPTVIALPPETLIVFDLADQADLRGIVAGLEDLGLRIVSIHRVAPG
jgi:hypothetical protein